MDRLNGKKYEVMRVLWESSQPLSAYQILEREPEMKMPTIRKALEDMLKDKLIKVSGTTMNGRVYARTYVPVLSKEEYLQDDARNKRIEPTELVAALLDDTDLDMKTLEKLQKIIERKKKELKGE